MARHLVVLALIFVAVLAAGVSAQSPSASPKVAPASSESSSPSVAPPPMEEKSSSSSAATPESSSPALAPETDYAAPPAPGSEAYAPVEGPSEFVIDDSAPAPSGASGLKVSGMAGVAAAVAGLGMLL